MMQKKAKGANVRHASDAKVAGAAKGIPPVCAACVVCLAGLMVWMLPLFLTGCGYRTASAGPAGEARSLLVVPLENRTTTFEVEQIMTRALVRIFIEKSPYRVVNEMSRADLVVRGEIRSATATPVIFGRETFGTAFLVTLTARVELADRRSGKLLFANNNYVFREQYEINPDVKNFFSELNPALERIANDFASSVVATILADF